MSVTETAASLRELAEQSNAWPFEEARKVVARLSKAPKQEVIFETGYGPSGLPHIGTFGEVARTTMVRHAFRVLTDDKVKTRLIAFSDDMDGLRKVPDNVPNKELLTKHLGMPLTKVPDPFGTHPSFGEHNNARLRAFLDAFGFEYEFLSSTQCYTSGRFDATLIRMLERFDAVMDIMLPSLRQERAQSYSPFLPIDQKTGIVLQVPVVAHDAKAGTITYEDPETKQPVTTPVTGGRCKLQWKPDWAMRWVALGIDYEMAGKDLIDSVKLSGEICRAIGGRPPEGFNYELFLDEKGQKISKSKGNGLTIDEWLRYASPESLSLFMYREPKAAKRLYFDVIPRHVDEYQQFLDGYARQDGRQRLTNPVWHIHSGHPPKADMPISFSMLLTLVSSSNAENAETLWGFIGRYRPGVTPATHPKLHAAVEYAIHYFRDFVLPEKKFRQPNDDERKALLDLRDALSNLPADAMAEQIQDVVYEVGRRPPFLDEKKKAKDGKPGVALDWFNMLYQVLLGQEKGPRFGSFVAVYGLKNTVDMINGVLGAIGLAAAMDAASLALIGATIVLSSFISGVFGMAGGMVLLGVLLVYFDVATGMVLFSLIQLAANGWRSLHWRRFVLWPIFLWYVAGAVLAFGVMRAVAFVPDKATVYLLLGAIPFMVEALPTTMRPNIQWRGVPFITGVLTTVIQFLAGVGGLFLDIFFQKSNLDRKTMNATKAITQTFSHVLRAAYFGSLAGIGELSASIWAPAMVLALVGTSLAPFVLERMTDHGFRQWTRAIIFTLAIIYLIRGGLLMWRA